MGEVRIEIFQYLCPQCKARGEFACGTGHSGGCISEFAADLRLTTAKVNRAPLSSSVAVVHRIFAGQAHPCMVPVIGNLVVKFSLGRVHPVQPVEPPFYFVHNVRDTVSSGVSGSVVSIAECFRVLQIGKHHLVNGIGRGCGILQIVGRVMPSSPDIDVLSGLCRMIHDKAVMYMATVFQEGVVTASLLAHVIQQEVGRSVVYPVVDGEVGRYCFSGFQIVGSGCIKGTEVQPVG